MSDRSFWGIHAKGPKVEEVLLSRNQLAIGWADIGGPTVAELLGNLAPGEYGLIVTLGTFTAQAKSRGQEKPNIRLIDGDDLVDLILDHYEELDPRYKSVIPLKRMYVPQPLPED